MHATLRTTLAAAALIAAVPAAGIASAHEGKGRGKQEAKVKQGKGDERCRKGGRGYEAQGLLADGSSLTQVAGADTRRPGDDRFSGTVVVQVRQGNRRGRADKGLTSYALENVRALGTAAGEDPLPPVGTKVLLVGKLPKAACTPPAPSPSPEPSTLPSPTPEPTATAASYDDASEAPSDDAPEATTPDAGASAAVIRMVVFKAGRERTRPAGDDRTAGRSPGKGRPISGRGEDGADDAPEECPATKASRGGAPAADDDCAEAADQSVDDSGDDTFDDDAASDED